MDANILYRLKNVMVEILDDFSHFCETNNLTYFLEAGTLLGAVRHKGYIPWDDDIDVAMPRADYNKFIQMFNNIGNSDYYLIFIDNNYFQWLKLCKKNTIYAERESGQFSNQGIFIDIWPYDKTFIFFLPLQTFFIKLIKKIYRVKTNVDIEKSKFRKNLLKMLSILIPLKFCKWFPEKMCRIFNKFNTNYITCFSNADVKKVNFKIETVFPLIKLLFEGKYYYAPCNYDVYLKTTYGNYMELPPVDERISHNPLYVIFDTNVTNKEDCDCPK